MKIELKDLIENKYYICKYNNSYTISYYKYHYRDKTNIYFFNEKFEETGGDMMYCVFRTVQCTIESFKYCCYMFEEIDPIILIDYFPDYHPDKKYLLRKQKINSLLSK